MNDIPDCMYDYRREEPPAKIVDVCDFCGGNIYEGEEYYDFNGDIRCELCVDEYVEHYRKGV